jgi:hypothetical protein
MDGKVGLRDITLPAIGHHYQTEICKKKKLVPYGKAYLFPAKDKRMKFTKQQGPSFSEVDQWLAWRLPIRQRRSLVKVVRNTKEQMARVSKIFSATRKNEHPNLNLSWFRFLPNSRR